MPAESANLGKALKTALSGAALMAISGAFQPALAEMEIAVYTGYQAAPHSGVSGNDPAAGGAGAFDFNAGWDGKPFAMPPHYGIRGTWWRSERLGFTADFNHTKIYADDATLAASGFETLEFTDGLNNLTFGVMGRWPSESRSWTPYAGVSAGIVIPRVEVQTGAAAPATDEYQIVGPSVALVLGASTPLSDRISLFGEYKGTYSQINADLTGGGTLESNVITNALNIGLAYRF